jgi:hypothetical protein
MTWVMTSWQVVSYAHKLNEFIHLTTINEDTTTNKQTNYQQTNVDTLDRHQLNDKASQSCPFQFGVADAISFYLHHIISNSTYKEMIGVQHLF